MRNDSTFLESFFVHGGSGVDVLLEMAMFDTLHVDRLRRAAVEAETTTVALFGAVAWIPILNIFRHVDGMIRAVSGTETAFHTLRSVKHHLKL